MRTKRYTRQTLSFPSDLGGVVLQALCTALQNTDGIAHRNTAEAAAVIAGQYSPEWVSCIASHIKLDPPKPAR